LTKQAHLVSKTTQNEAQTLFFLFFLAMDAQPIFTLLMSLFHDVAENMRMVTSEKSHEQLLLQHAPDAKKIFVKGMTKLKYGALECTRTKFVELFVAILLYCDNMSAMNDQNRFGEAESGPIDPLESFTYFQVTSVVCGEDLPADLTSCMEALYSNLLCQHRNPILCILQEIFTNVTLYTREDPQIVSVAPTTRALPQPSMDSFDRSSPIQKLMLLMGNF